jgi:hypothetical protein
MKIAIRLRSIVSVFVACLLIATVPAAQAQTGAQLDKHARKVEKHLAKFHSGTYLRFDFRDNTQSFGSLGSLSNASFQFTDSDSNTVVTRSYDDLANVTRGKEYIGEGSEPGRHVRLLVPLLIGAVAAGATVAVVEALR